jgi:hypothetical protein
MKKKLLLALLFLMVFAADFFGLLVLWSKAMACADIGHGCRLGLIDRWAFEILGFPMSLIPDDLLLAQFFGADYLSLLLLSNAGFWGIGAVFAALLIHRFHARKQA